MTTLENSLYTEPTPTTIPEPLYFPHTEIQHRFDESDAPTEDASLYSARWRDLRKFGGTGDPTQGNAWSRKYNFVSLPLFQDAETAKQIENHKKVLSNPSNAITSSRRKRYVDMVQGRSRFSSKYATQNSKGTNYNTHNLIHVDSSGEVLNTSDILPSNIEIGPFPPVVSMVPLISQEMTNPFPQIITPVTGRFMPPPDVIIPPSVEYGVTNKPSFLLNVVASNPDVIESVSQRYIFKLNGKQSIASSENVNIIEQHIKNSTHETFDERTNLFIDERMEYYILRRDNPHPTWDSPSWVRHYLTPEGAMNHFGRGKSGPIIPGIDMTVTKWIENPNGVIIIDFVGTFQYHYGNTEGTEGFRIIYQ